MPPSIAQHRNLGGTFRKMTGCRICAQLAWIGLGRRTLSRRIRPLENGVSEFSMPVITRARKLRRFNWAMCTALTECAWGTDCRCSPSASARGVGLCHWRSVGFRQNPIRLLMAWCKSSNSSNGMDGRLGKLWSWMRSTQSSRFRRPVHELGLSVLGRVASNRVFYLGPPAYRGFGRPPVRGRKIKLNDARTLPPIDAQDEWKLEAGGRIEVSRWDDVRMRQWPAQQLVLYRVIEYRADGK